MKQKALIVDIDGTLANTDHREHLAKTKNWPGFFAAGKDDPPITEIIDLVSRYADHKIILCTGRPENYRILTVEWLAKHEIPYEKLYMRLDNDFRSDAIIKETIYRQKIEPYYKISFVLDDRKKVVLMWRKIGLRCLQVADGDF